MSTTLEVKLRTQAAAYSDLTALLGTSPFRWYDTQLVQGTAFPAVTVLLVAGNKTYALNGRLSTGWSRVQFTIWANDPETARSVENALVAFLDTFNGDGLVTNQQKPNYVVMQRQLLFPETQPPKYQRINDAMIFSNDTV